jgi:hypothetical protein
MAAARGGRGMLIRECPAVFAVYRRVDLPMVTDQSRGGSELIKCLRTVYLQTRGELAERLKAAVC